MKSDFFFFLQDMLTLDCRQETGLSSICVCVGVEFGGPGVAKILSSIENIQQVH